MERHRLVPLVIQLLHNKQPWIDRAAASLALQTVFVLASGWDSPYRHSFGQHIRLVPALRAPIIDRHHPLPPVDG